MTNTIVLQQRVRKALGGMAPSDIDLVIHFLADAPVDDVEFAIAARAADDKAWRAQTASDQRSAW